MKCLAPVEAAKPETAQLEVAALLAMPLALQRRVLHAVALAARHPGGLPEVEQAVRALVAQVRSAKVNLPGSANAAGGAGYSFCE